MKIHRLKLKRFRNLCDFELCFDSQAQNESKAKSYAVIGQNGSGKSNMLEALVTIFRDLDLNLPASLDYELDYTVREFQIEIKGAKDKTPDVKINGVKTEAWLLSDEYVEDSETEKPVRGSARLYLPSHVFCYYSGKSERLEQIFEPYQERFLERLVDDRDYALNPLDEDTESLAQTEGLLQRVFYCRNPHARLVLLACLLAPEKPLKGVLENMNIIELDSAIFTLKQPYRLTDEHITQSDILKGDNRFWYDQSQFSQEFLDKLWDLSTAPIDFTEEKIVDFRGRKEEQEILYLFVDSREKLAELRDHIGDSYRFFRFLEGSYIADLLDDLKIFVKHQNASGLITFDQLSEGEMQFLTVLGLMRLTHQDHCLFLLDEPDTHLNPKWKLDYFDKIESVLSTDHNSILKGASQIIVTTHDPMMIGGLRKEQVRVMKNSPKGTIVEELDEHPQGMGVAGLLKSEYFGLPSTLDSETRQKMQQRNELLAKRKKEGLSETEESLLKRLQDHLEDLGFSKVSRDPLYQMFIEQMYEVRSLPLDETLKPEVLEKQEALAKEIVTKLVNQERSEELLELARELGLNADEES